MIETGAHACAHPYTVSWTGPASEEFWACTSCGQIFRGGRWDGGAQSEKMKVVPADAVVISPEIAETAAEACALCADNIAQSAAFMSALNDEDADQIARGEHRYRAAAAALRGKERT